MRELLKRVASTMSENSPAGITNTDFPATDNEPFNFESCEQVAVVEIDRYCHHCGYNLRMSPVRRDPRTEILLARCPECGRFASAADSTSAARPWLKLLIGFLFVAWLLILAGLVVGAGLAQGGLTPPSRKEADIEQH